MSLMKHQHLRLGLFVALFNSLSYFLGPVNNQITVLTRQCKSNPLHDRGLVQADHSLYPFVSGPMRAALPVMLV